MRMRGTGGSAVSVTEDGSDRCPCPCTVDHEYRVTVPRRYIPSMGELPVEAIRNAREHLADVVDRADRDETPTYATMRRDLEQFTAANPSDDPTDDLRACWTCRCGQQDRERPSRGRPPRVSGQEPSISFCTSGGNSESSGRTAKSPAVSGVSPTAIATLGEMPSTS